MQSVGLIHKISFTTVFATRLNMCLQKFAPSVICIEIRFMHMFGGLVLWLNVLLSCYFI